MTTEDIDLPVKKIGALAYSWNKLKALSIKKTVGLAKLLCAIPNKSFGSLCVASKAWMSPKLPGISASLSSGWPSRTAPNP